MTIYISKVTGALLVYDSYKDRFWFFYGIKGTIIHGRNLAGIGRSPDDFGYRIELT